MCVVLKVLKLMFTFKKYIRKIDGVVHIVLSINGGVYFAKKGNVLYKRL